MLKLNSIWDQLQPLWADIKNSVYNLKPGKTCLGFSPAGCTTYLSKNCSAADNEKVQKWLKSENMECYNTRLFKTEHNSSVSFIIIYNLNYFYFLTLWITCLNNNYLLFLKIKGVFSFYCSLFF